MQLSQFPRSKVAVIMAQSGKSLNYGELEDLSNQIAHLFRSNGLKRGNVIALCLENHWLFLPICWAATRAGLYFTAISYRLQSEEVEYIVNDCEAKMLITSRLLSDTFRQLSGKLIHDPVCYMIDGVVSNAQSFEAAYASLPTRPISDQSYGASMLYSSGTTGRPKGIKRPLTDIPWGDELPQALSLNRYNYDEKTVYLSPAPLYHAAPLAFNMAINRFGGTTIVMEQFDAERSMALIQQYGITHSQWVPTMFIRMLKLDQVVRDRYDISSLQVAVHAAAPCPIPVKEQMIEWWGPVIEEYYAGTESNGRTALGSQEWLAHKGSVGKAINCVVHILDDDDDEIEVGELGGVYFESSGVYEYLNDPEKTAAAKSKQGWTTLGDVGYLDSDGYLFLTDRKSFMIISGGVNIYPQETEDALIEHPKVMDVAVFGVPNSDFGEEVKAVVQVVAGIDAGPLLENELIAYAKSKISPIKCPKSVDFIAELPRHPTGKLYKRLLKDKYWNEAKAKQS